MGASSSPNTRRIFTVGLTGGIASGKSLVASMFVALGAKLVDTDVIAREVVAPGQPVLHRLREAFGPAVFNANGELNRAALRSLVFDDAAKRRELEAVLHPLIRSRTVEALDRLSGPYALVAVPLLVETDFIELVDRVLVVDSSVDQQLERLMRRDGLSRSAALAMIRAQTDRAVRLQAAHDIIDNSGDQERTRRQVLELHARYLELAKRTVAKN